MSEFRYELPSESKQQQWEMLSDEARIALSDTTLQLGGAEQLIEAGEFSMERPAKNYVEFVNNWAISELFPDNPNCGMNAYISLEETLGIEVPRNLEEFDAMSNNVTGTLWHLFDSKYDIYKEHHKTREGDNLAGDLKLVAIPYAAFRNHLADFDFWFRDIRKAQGITALKDQIDGWLLKAITDNVEPFYRDPMEPVNRLTAGGYLRHKIQKIGSWGLMLMQTSEFPGLKIDSLESHAKRINNDWPQYELPANGSILRVDEMGVFEWLALSMQYDPSSFSENSALMANFVYFQGIPHAAAAKYNEEDNQVKLSMCDVSDRNLHIQPRIAIR